MAPVINPQHNPTYAILDNGCTRSMGSWHAIQRFTQAIDPMKDIISYEYIPAETKFFSVAGAVPALMELSMILSCAFRSRTVDLAMVYSVPRISV